MIPVFCFVKKVKTGSTKSEQAPKKEDRQAPQTRNPCNQPATNCVSKHLVFIVTRYYDWRSRSLAFAL
jgi:hypothetical protein